MEFVALERRQIMFEVATGKHQHRLSGFGSKRYETLEGNPSRRGVTLLEFRRKYCHFGFGEPSHPEHRRRFLGVASEAVRLRRLAFARGFAPERRQLPDVVDAFRNISAIREDLHSTSTR